MSTMTSHTIAVHITVDDQSHPGAVSELLAELSSRFKEVTRAEFMLGGQRWGGAETLNVRRVKTAADVVAVSARDRRHLAAQLETALAHREAGYGDAEVVALWEFANSLARTLQIGASDRL
jgi:hypothetical protein